ncbi:type IV toxin-antitoxin system AbiEi family antitoxin domain-containing protein [Rhodococcus sp. G-MC3]|uniref:type IV toxin-antitoxin system AbiEi family antitoxin domain-containing protein n=1 Tax=Rhodococcus sp. G-MC3 TaxID=3046209 RepID=UPI0024B8FE0E|nr:type IV toxin-antitoxin system AbiEi family antitoxin domain-containing protein [Rhodococcus sp. G-MC3]MDJ0395402.1 type IV toxin-antitoxin system AbiEi family antitoxin domain-containing protein [Rhodococcus sp. G-MC3]
MIWTVKTKAQPDWKQLLDAQHGIVTTAQIYKCGMTRQEISHRVETGQWLRVFRGIVSVTNGPLTREMMLSAALLYGGGGALLSHRTAAEEWGVMRQTDGPIHVTVAYGCSAISQPSVFRHALQNITSESNARIHPGVIVHRSRAMSHIGVETEPLRTGLADTVLDCAVAEPSVRTAMIVLVSAMSSGGVQVGVVHQKIELRRPRRYKKALLDTLALLRDGVHSVLEYRYVRDVEQAHGLPTGRRQAPVHVDGRQLFEDVLYDVCGLIVRLDGQAFHSAKQRRFRDRRRDNAAELRDVPRLVYGWDEVTADPCGVYREVRDVLVREGWDDASFPCDRCSL